MNCPIFSQLNLHIFQQWSSDSKELQARPRKPYLVYDSTVPLLTNVDEVTKTSSHGSHRDTE